MNIIWSLIVLLAGLSWRFFCKNDTGYDIQDAHSVIQNIDLIGEFLTRSYLPKWDVYSENKESLEQIRDDFDPRLILSLYLHKLNSHGKDPKHGAFTLDFSWSFFVDPSKIVDYNNSLDFRKFKVTFENNSNFNFNHPTFPVESLHPVDEDLSEEIRSIVGLSYLLATADTPQTIIFLGSGSSLIDIPLRKAQEPTIVMKNLVLNLLTENHASYLRLKDEVIRFNLNINMQNITGKSQQDCLENGRSRMKSLTKEDFYFNELEVNSFNFHSKNVSSNNSKYFHEALITGSDEGGHYDWRFFKTLSYSSYERQSILHRLTRAWLRFSESSKIKTWLAHGSLLGWYWNGLNLPWDQDIDVQITMSSLMDLALKYNQSIVVDLDENDLNTGTSVYLIDVSSNIFNRETSDGLNTIDARFIDVSSGMYVDITALTYGDDIDTSEFSLKKMKEFNQMLDSDFVSKENSRTIDKDQLNNELQATKKSLIKNNMLLNCKDNHFYKLEELTPLVHTMFEGYSAYVPNNFKALLKREYSHGLYSTQHEGYTYRPVLDIWVPSYICKKDPIGNSCQDQNTLLEANYTKSITSKRRQEKLPKFSPSDDWFLPVPPIRIDLWIIDRSNQIMDILRYSNMYK